MGLGRGLDSLLKAYDDENDEKTQKTESSVSNYEMRHLFLPLLHQQQSKNLILRAFYQIPPPYSPVLLDHANSFLMKKYHYRYLFQ